MITVLLSITALIIWLASFLVGYKNGLSLVSSRALLVLGVVTMFCLPSIYLFLAGEPQVYPLMFYEYYPFALGLLNLAGIGFLLVSLAYNKKFVPVKRTNGFGLSQPKKQKIIFFSVLFCLLGIFALFQDIQTCTFYHFFRSDYQFQQYDIIVLLSEFKELMVLGAFALFAIGTIDKKKFLQFFGAIVLVFFLVFGLVSGSKITVLKLILQAIIFSVLLGWKPKLWHIITIFVIGLMLISKIDYYNSALNLSVSSECQMIEPTKAINAYIDTNGLTNAPAATNSLTNAMARLAVIRPVAAVYSAVPEIVPFQFGYTYRHIFFVFIPRLIWHEKPDMRESAQIMETIIPNEAGSEPLTWLGEAFLNFGWLGAFLVGIVLAFFSIILDYKLLQKYNNNLLFICFFATYGFQLVWAEKTLIVLVTNFIKLFIIFLIIDKISNIDFAKIKKAIARRL